VLCYLDRTNLSFAALELNRDLHLSCSTYGLGASLFFVSYALFQIPSTLACARLGAPTWLAANIVAWGLVAAMFSLANGVPAFLLLRFLLGATESAAFPGALPRWRLCLCLRHRSLLCVLLPVTALAWPRLYVTLLNLQTFTPPHPCLPASACTAPSPAGMWYHLSTFYSESELGPAYAKVASCTALAQVVGAPLAAAILAMDGLGGLAGWQWLFLLEGCLTVAFGVVLRLALAPSPAKARMLTHPERAWLQQRQDDARAATAAAAAGGRRQQQQAGEGGASGSSTTTLRQHFKGVLGELAAAAVWQSGWLLSMPSTIWLCNQAEQHHAAQPGARTADPRFAPFVASLYACPAGVLRDWRILWLSACWLLTAAVMFGITFFLPLMLKDMFSGSVSGAPGGGGHSACSGGESEVVASGEAGQPGQPPVPPQQQQDQQSSSLVALASAVPFILAACGMNINARLAERANERHRHAGVPILLAGVALGLVPLALSTAGPALAFVLLSLATGLCWSFHGG
jgi:MFS family permease